MARVARLVERRDYSRKEVADKLAEDGYSHSCIDRVVERACSCRLVDDARFADVFIRTKVYAGWGAARIARELARRGVDVSSVEGWPHEYLVLEDEAAAADCFDPESGELLLGDIVISVERAAEQAEEYGHSLRREIAFLTAHSMLHLLGYDHMEAAEAEDMERRQEEILQALGITREE